MNKSKNHLKLKQFSSNKAIYTQLFLNHKVLITNKNNFYSEDKESGKIKNSILNLYNNKSIKYNTLEYLLIQNKLKSNNFIKVKNIQLSIEHSIESGLEYI